MKTKIFLAYKNRISLTLLLPQTFLFFSFNQQYSRINMSHDKQIDEVHVHFEDLFGLIMFIFICIYLTDVLYNLKSCKKIYYLCWKRWEKKTLTHDFQQEKGCKKCIYIHQLNFKYSLDIIWHTKLSPYSIINVLCMNNKWFIVNDKLSLHFKVKNKNTIGTTFLIVRWHLNKIVSNNLLVLNKNNR